MSEANGTPRPTGELTVALDMPSARELADQAAAVGDLQFVMDCSRRLLAELAKPEEQRDGIVPLALWSAAVLAYGRCFGTGGRALLTTQDVESLPLQGAVLDFHTWVIRERDKLTEPSDDPFEAAKVGAELSPEKAGTRRVQGIGVFATSRVLIDATGVRQLGGLATELAKQIAVKAQKQQEVVLAETKERNLDSLYAAPLLRIQPPAAEEAAAAGS